MEHHIHGVRVKCYFYVHIRYSLHKQRCRCVGVEDQKFLLTALLTLLTKSYISVASANRHLRGAVLTRYCFVNDRMFSRRNRGGNMNAWIFGIFKFFFYSLAVRSWAMYSFRALKSFYKGSYITLIQFYFRKPRFFLNNFCVVEINGLFTLTHCVLVKKTSLKALPIHRFTRLHYYLTTFVREIRTPFVYIRTYGLQISYLLISYYLLNSLFINLFNESVHLPKGTVTGDELDWRLSITHFVELRFEIGLNFSVMELRNFPSMLRIFFATSAKRKM